MPRSVSEFNLAASAGSDIAVSAPMVASLLKGSSGMIGTAGCSSIPVDDAADGSAVINANRTEETIGGTGGTSVAVATNSTLVLRTADCLVSDKGTRSREKTVTFEDEGANCKVVTPTRKNQVGVTDNAFM